MTQPTIYQALANVMDEVQGVAKKDRNLSQGFNFRGIDAVVNAVGPALRKHSVIVTPMVISHEYSTVEVGKNRTLQGHVIVHVVYTFHGPAGDSIETSVIGEAMDSGDKAVAKAMSVAFRIALLQALALPTDEPDPDSYSYERSEAKAKPSTEQYEAWVWRMNGASTLEDLNSVGVEANEFDLTPEQRENLRSLFVERRDALKEA